MSIYREVLGFFSPNTTQYIVSMRWQVYENYEIRDFTGEEKFTVKDTKPFGGERRELKLFECLYTEEEITSTVTLMPGKYITWFEEGMAHNQVKHSYNPIEDGSALLERFLRLGYGNVPTRMILSFVNKYGVLKEIEHIGTELSSGFVYPRYPVEALKKYAREAYYVKNLFHLISTGDIRSARDALKVVSDNILGGFESVADPFEAIVDFGAFVQTWWDRMPKYFRAHLASLMPKDESGEVAITKAGKTIGSENRQVPTAFFMPFLSKEFWDIFSGLAPNDMIIDYADKLISAIFDSRLWKDMQIDPVADGSFLAEGEPTLSYRLRPKSLLSATWFLLYMDITNQSVSYYSFCDYCGKRIQQKVGEKSYRGNIYCSDNHRSYAYIRDMKSVIELRKAGASLNIIKEAYPRRSEDSIVKWLKKEGIDVAK